MYLHFDVSSKNHCLKLLNLVCSHRQVVDASQIHLNLLQIMRTATVDFVQQNIVLLGVRVSHVKLYG